MKNLFLICCSIFALAACSTPTPSDTPTKEEARNQVAKGDAPYDVCAEFGWYGDGICDDFCQYPDVEDCGDDSPLCYSNADCDAGESCNAADVCLSPCPEGMICTQVCAGFCVPDAEPDECWGAWVDQFGNCRGPADGVLEDTCCFQEMCGGIAGLICGDDEYCDYGFPYPEGADISGVCKPIPEICYEIYAPVCGTDGQTHANDCYAHAAGASVLHEGPCVDPDACGDGTPALCTVEPPVCDEGLIAPVINHCYGPCVDPETCEPEESVEEDECDVTDGSGCEGDEFCMPGACLLWCEVSDPTCCAPNTCESIDD